MASSQSSLHARLGNFVRLLRGSRARSRGPSTPRGKSCRATLRKRTALCPLPHGSCLASSPSPRAKGRWQPWRLRRMRAAASPQRKARKDKKAEESIANEEPSTAKHEAQQTPGTHSLKVHWKPSKPNEGDSENEKGGEEVEEYRPTRSSRTLHTWLHAIVSEDGLAAVAAGSDQGSPAVGHVRSSRSQRTLARSLPSSPTSCRSRASRAASRGRASPATSPSSLASRSPCTSVDQSVQEEEAASILAVLREHFLSSVDADGSGRLSRQELFDHIKELLESSTGTALGEDQLELLSEVERCRFAEIDLGLGAGERGGLGIDEWLHFMLLRGSAPSHVAAKHLNRRLRKALESDPELLSRLHSAFEAADTEGDGLLRQEKWSEAFRAVGMSHPPQEVGLDQEEDGSPWALSYYEFVGHALGLKASVVELALYDLSKGVARWVPAALLGGHRFDGIWHSGIRVFGKEFWFGGVILESNFEDVPFGAPARVLRLGTTLRTYDELVEFLKEDVYVDYNPKSYDVLRRNCNHFSNELVQFLLHGKQLPEEVLLQPEWVQHAALVSTLRPLLNRYLGGFEEPGGGPLRGGEVGGDSPCAPQAVTRIDDMTEEWRSRLEAGDLVMHRKRFVDRPRPARVLSVSTAATAGGSRRAQISFLQPTVIQRWEDVSSTGTPWSWEVVCESDVPLRQFYPLLDVDEAEGSAHILKAGMAQRDPRAKAVLLRPRKMAVRPVCAKGHWLREEEETSSWWSGSSVTQGCGVCGELQERGHARQSCSRCAFALCHSCLQRGAALAPDGAFTDVLSPELARALLKEDAGWLKYKARCYFFKADHNAVGSIDKAKARRVDNRLSAELGVRPWTETELVKELQRLCGQTAEGTTALDEAKFQDFFAEALSRALASIESGKTWRPRARVSRGKIGVRCADRDNSKR
eukprot:gb/GFBE01061128.1/.p1 GENE.gb/GFBE01061128.1/~~gb/GFBE01061128.1/.p1  ORF type:complete len:925 (+),score=157.38 gb/GFBE01061128.1/:1-2775(+)